MNQFLPLLDKAKVVTGLAPIVPSSSTPDYVSMKGFQKLTIIIIADNATSVTGSAISLLQATTVAAGGAKALAMPKMYANADTGAADTLTETAVTSDTFTTATTDNKNLLYVIEIDADDLDADGGFDCVRAVTGNAANTVVAVIYILHGTKYMSALDRAAITD